MNQIVNIFNSINTAQHIYRMNECELKDSTSTLANHYNNDLLIDFVRQTIELNFFFFLVKSNCKIQFSL